MPAEDDDAQNRPPPPPRLIAGAMSGTSADGVDVALTRVTGRGTDMRCELVHHHHRDYPAPLKQEIFAFRGGDAAVNLARLAQLGRDVSLAYAAAVNDALAEAKLTAADLTAVAAHGQTLYHGPPNTIQWFDPSLVAAAVGVPVVSDFRRADLAAGGQGAPLVPFADYVLFRHPTETRVLLNVGGIANLTYLRAGGRLEEVIAYDTGPGNCISDHLCRLHDPSGPGYDDGGERAERGRVHTGLAGEVLRAPYFLRPPPKSTDGPEMVGYFEAALDKLRLRDKLGLEDLLATAAFITTKAVLFEVARLGGADVILASGGGTRNLAIRFGLSVTTVPLQIMAESEAKEALAFALLAAATLDGVPSNVPSVTGAKRPVVLGSITPKP